MKKVYILLSMTCLLLGCATGNQYIENTQEYDKFLSLSRTITAYCDRSDLGTSTSMVLDQYPYCFYRLCSPDGTCLTYNGWRGFLNYFDPNIPWFLECWPKEIPFLEKINKINTTLGIASDFKIITGYRTEINLYHAEGTTCALGRTIRMCRAYNGYPVIDNFIEYTFIDKHNMIYLIQMQDYPYHKIDERKKNVDACISLALRFSKKLESLSGGNSKSSFVSETIGHSMVYKTNERQARIYPVDVIYVKVKSKPISHLPPSDIVALYKIYIDTRNGNMVDHFALKTNEDDHFQEICNKLKRGDTFELDEEKKHEMLF